MSMKIGLERNLMVETEPWLLVTNGDIYKMRDLLCGHESRHNGMLIAIALLGVKLAFALIVVIVIVAEQDLGLRSRVRRVMMTLTPCRIGRQYSKQFTNSHSLDVLCIYRNGRVGLRWNKYFVTRRMKDQAGANKGYSFVSISLTAKVTRLST